MIKNSICFILVIVRSESKLSLLPTTDVTAAAPLIEASVTLKKVSSVLVTLWGTRHDDASSFCWQPGNKQYNG